MNRENEDWNNKKGQSIALTLFCLQQNMQQLIFLAFRILMHVSHFFIMQGDNAGFKQVCILQLEVEFFRNDEVFK
jgi:hypothetical protein